jgi:branched-chain amino acid transport system substrate-binding protein
MKQPWLKLNLIAAAACFAAAAAAQSNVIKIGVNQPLTGVVAASGNFVTSGARIAADEINAKGGINGSKIQLVIEDNKSNPTEAVNATEKLIVRDKVPVIMGAWSSTYTLAAMPKLMEYKVPMVVETSGADKITTSGNPYVFRICPTNDMEAKSFARHVEPLKIKKADLLVVNNDWGRGSADSFKQMLEAKGVKVGRILTMDAAALSAQGRRCRHTVRDDGGRAAHAGAQAGAVPGPEAPDHHPGRLAKPGPAGRARRCRGHRHHAQHDVRAVGT